MTARHECKNLRKKRLEAPEDIDLLAILLASILGSGGGEALVLDRPFALEIDADLRRVADGENGPFLAVAEVEMDLAPPASGGLPNLFVVKDKLCADRDRGAGPATSAGRHVPPRSGAATPAK